MFAGSRCVRVFASMFAAVFACSRVRGRVRVFAAVFACSRPCSRPRVRVFACSRLCSQLCSRVRGRVRVFAAVFACSRACLRVRGRVRVFSALFAATFARSCPWGDIVLVFMSAAQVTTSSDQRECFPVFSRAFTCKPDRGPHEDPAVLQHIRFHACRRVELNYNDSALLWKQPWSRLPKSSERAAMIGVPPGLPKWAPKGRAGDDSQQAEQEVLAHWQQLPRPFLCGCAHCGPPAFWSNWHAPCSVRGP